MCCSGEGSLLASGSADNTVRLWDVNASSKSSRAEEKYDLLSTISSSYVCITCRLIHPVGLLCWSYLYSLLIIVPPPVICLLFCLFPGLYFKSIYVLYAIISALMTLQQFYALWRSGGTRHLRLLKTLPTKSTPVYALKVHNLPFENIHSSCLSFCAAVQTGMKAHFFFLLLMLILGVDWVQFSRTNLLLAAGAFSPLKPSKSFVWESSVKERV